MTEKIEKFDGKYRFLSNFWKEPFKIDGKIYITNEHYYQSMKTKSTRQRERIRNASTPRRAKKIGRSTSLRDDWDEIKIDVMHKGLLAKFGQNEWLKTRLLETGNTHLQEGNSWGDTFWGVDLQTGRGQNHLGELLMQVRDELRQDAAS